MIYARTPAGKRALADVLADEDPAFLADLTMLAGKLGKFTAVGYLSDDAAINQRVFDSMQAAKLAHIESMKNGRTK